MKVSVFETTFALLPTYIDLESFSELVENVGPHRFDYASKDAVPLLSPAEFTPGSTRSAASAVRVHFGMVDLDKLSEEQLLEIRERLLQRRISHCFYSTWSHGTEGKGCCVRVLFPLSRAVEKSEWQSFWLRMNNDLFRGLVDPATKNIDRLFYFPSAPEARAEEALHEAFLEGGPFDVDACLSAPAPAVLVVTNMRVTRGSLEAWARGLRTSWVKTKAMLLLAGQAVAEQGDRDNTVFRLCSALVREFPTATAESLAKLFAESCQAMSAGAEDPITVDDVLDKVKRLQSESAQQEVAQENKKLEERRQLISRAFKGKRETPYTASEIAEYEKEAPVRWVVQKNGTFWVFFNGEYRGPYDDKEIVTMAQQLLAAATHVDLYKTTDRGVRLKTGYELVYDYGAVAQSVKLDMTAQRSYWNEAEETLVEAPCPRRPLQAQKSEKVKQWLRIFGGDKHETLLDWLASLPRLDRPCAALYMHGARGTGKSLLMNACAALWTEEGPTALEDAFGAFNSTLLQCPVVAADESMPVDIRGRQRTGKLREFIQARTRTLNRKYIAQSKIVGCVRVMLAANNPDMIRGGGESLTLQDVEAICERIFSLRVPDEAAEFLRDNTLEPEEVARHIVWLSETRPVDSSHRFIVPGESADLVNEIATSTDVASAITNWIVAWLLNPAPLEATGTKLARIYDGKVYVATRAITDQWSFYPTNRPAPATLEAGRTLHSISVGDKRMLTAGDGRKTYYWRVNTEALVAWAERTHFTSREQLETSIAALDKKVKEKETN